MIARKEGRQFKQSYQGPPKKDPIASFDLFINEIPGMVPAPAIARHRRALAIMGHIIKIFKIVKGDKNNFDKNFKANITELNSIGSYNFTTVNEPYLAHYKKFMDEHWDELVNWDADFKTMIAKK